MKYLRSLFPLWIVAAAAHFLVPTPGASQEPPPRPRIGFTTALTGDGAVSGHEMRNAALLANELIANNAFEIKFEDDRCLGAPAATAAQKFATIDRVDYAMGFFCNVSLLTAAPLYAKAHVPVISTCATTMDTPDVGERIYRLFPADQLSIPVLYHHVSAHSQRVGILAEEDAYAQMLKREFERQHELAHDALTLSVIDYPFENLDFRTLLLRFKSQGVDTIFIDSATEPSFIRVVRQMRELDFLPKIVGVYTPVSEIARESLGSALEGAVAVTLPDLEKRAANPNAARLMREYRSRFGAPKSAFPVILTTFEAIRLLASAHELSRPIEEISKDPTILSDSLVGPYNFDSHGAVQGISFELQTIRNGKVVSVPEP